MPVAFASVLAELDITPPFVGPSELERRRGRAYRARLGANECLFGVSPAAMRVVAARCAGAALYSDPTHTELRTVISEAWRISRHHVVVAEGIEGLLGLFVRAIIDPGDVAVTSLGGYPSFDYYLRGCAGKLVHQPYLASATNDLDGLLEAARRHHAKLVYLANPDNPTGTQIAPAEIRRMLDRLPEGCALLLDEAYVEFAEPDRVIPEHEIWPNLIRLRTFSKIYGLAGLRVGFAVAAPAVIDVLGRVCRTFHVSSLALVGALAALDDTEHVERTARHARRVIERYRAEIRGPGVTLYPSVANFVLIDCGRPSAPIYDQLLRLGVIVRPMAAWGLPNHLRISVAGDGDLPRVIGALNDVFAR